MSSISSLASSFSAIQASQTRQEIGVAVVKKSMDAAKQQGAAAISLLEGAAEMQQMSLNKNVGRNLDVRG